MAIVKIVQTPQNEETIIISAKTLDLLCEKWQLYKPLVLKAKLPELTLNLT